MDGEKDACQHVCENKVIMSELTSIFIHVCWSGLLGVKNSSTSLLQHTCIKLDTSKLQVAMSYDKKNVTKYTELLSSKPVDKVWITPYVDRLLQIILELILSYHNIW
jgi:hypothetical protein